MFQIIPIRGVMAALGLIACISPPSAAQATGAESPTASEASRHQRLVKTYRDMLQEDPDQDYALRRLLEVSHAVGGVKGLLKIYEKEVANKPKSYASWMVLGHIHRASEAVGPAESAYRKASSLKPRSPSPHLAAALLFRRVTRYEAALAAYDKAIALLKNRTRKQDALKAAAETAIQAQKGKRAETYFKALVKTDRRNLFLRMEYAATLARLGETKRSLELWLEIKTSARRQLRHLVIVWQESAQLQERLGKLDDAEDTWREALKKTPRGHWSRPTFLEGLIGLYRKKDKLRQLISELEPKIGARYEMLITVARLYEELADDTKALGLFKQAVKRRPSDSRARMRMIALLERIGTSEEVIAAYKKLIRTHPGEPRHELRLATLYFQQGRVKLGFERLTRMSRRYAEDPGVHQAIIDLTMRYGDVQMRKRIETAYKKLIRLEPREESHIISLGEYYWSDGNRPRALSVWKKLLKMGRSKGHGHFLLAEVYADHGMFAEADAEFEKALAKEPANERFAKAYAMVLHKRKRYRRALKQWQRVIETAKRSSAIREARRQIISLWERDRRLEGEIQKLEKRFSGTPPSLESGHFLATAYLRLRRTADALRILERLRKLEPNGIETLVGLEMVYTRLSRISEAIGVLEHLARVNTRSASEYMHRAADLALGNGDTTRALLFMRQVVGLNPADPAAHARVGELYRRMGNLADAAESWRQALVLDPRNHRVRFQLAALYRDSGALLREEQMLGQIVRDAREPADILRAGRRMLQVAGVTGRMEAMEGVVRPLVFNHQNKNVYLRLLVEVYALLSQQHAYSDKPRDERRAMLSAVGGRGLKPLLDALTDADIGLRARALEVLRLTRPAGAAPALARLLTSGDSQLQFQAAIALGHVGTTSAAAALVKLIDRSRRNDPTRQVAIWALGLTNGPTGVPLLTAEVASARSTATSSLAALALGRKRQLKSVERLEGLMRTRNKANRQAALWALASTAAPRSVSVVEAELRSGDAARASIAAWGLMAMRTDAAQLALLRALWSSDVRAEQAVADALWGSVSNSPRPQSQEHALAAAYESVIQLSSRRQRVSTAPRELFTLSRPVRPDDRVIAKHLARMEELLIRRATDIFAARESTAMVSLLRGLVRADGGAFALRTLLRDGSSAGAAIAEKVALHLHDAIHEAALGAFGPEVQPPALRVLTLLAARAKNPEHKQRVLATAEKVASEGEIQPRVAALHVMSRLGGQSERHLVGGIVEMMAESEDNWLLKGAAVSALGALGGDVATHEVGRRLGDRFAAVRAEAAKAALKLRAESLVSPLVSLVKDPAISVAENACRALAPFVGRRSVNKALRWAQTHGNTRLSAVATRVLEESQ